MYLIIDSTTRAGAVGLWQPGAGLRASRTWESTHNHTAELAPAIDAILVEAGLSPGSIAGIGVGIGPGGFSALRAGLGVAKGLAFSLCVPIAGVDTLEAAAYPFRTDAATICALLPAGRELVAWAVFRSEAGSWARISDDQVTALEDVLDAVDRGALFVGEAATAARGTIEARLGDRAAFAESDGPLVRLAGVAELALAQLERGESSPIAALQPNYVRPPSIGAPGGQRRVKLGGTSPRR